MVLSACSAYFEKLFLEHHAESACFQRPMIVVMRETSFEDLSFIIEFMYKGEINISRVCLEIFITFFFLWKLLDINIF
jgi:hypothetical protein